jgi:hypothetical protein
VAVTVVGATQGTAAVNSVGVTFPTGVQADDVLLVSLSVSGGTSRTITPPSGWSLLRRDDVSTTCALATYWRRATGGETSGTWAIDISVNSAWACVLLRGVDTTTAFEDNAGQASTTSTTSNTAPSVTPVGQNDLLVCVWANRRAGATSYTPPASMTEQADVSTATGTADPAVAVATEQLSASGATGTRTATQSASTNNHVAQSVAVKPAAGSTQTKNVGGAVTPAGNLTTLKAVGKAVAGAVGPAGTVTTQVQQASPAIERVGAATVATTGRYLDVPVPAGVSAGHVLVCGVTALGGTNTTITAPAGWTLLLREDHGTTRASAVYLRVADGTEPATYRWDFGTSAKQPVGIMGAWRRVDQQNPTDVAVAVFEDVNYSTANAAPSVTTVTGGCMLVTFHATKTEVTFTPGVTMSELAEVSTTTGTNDSSAMMADERLGVFPGETGTRTAIQSAATNSKHGFTVALRPATPPAAPTASGAGAVTPAGTVDARRVKTVRLAGATGPAGTLGRQPRRRFGGTISFAGFELAVEREGPLASPQPMTGAVGPSGTVSVTRLSSTAVVNLAGSVGPAGVLGVNGPPPPGGGGPPPPPPPADTLHDLEPPFDAVLLVPTPTDAVWLAPGTLDAGGT